MFKLGTGLVSSRINERWLFSIEKPGDKRGRKRESNGNRSSDLSLRGWSGRQGYNESCCAKRHMLLNLWSSLFRGSCLLYNHFINCTDRPLHVTNRIINFRIETTFFIYTNINLYISISYLLKANQLYKIISNDNCRNT